MLPYCTFLDDLVIVPAGLMITVLIIPAGLMQEFRAEAARRMEQGISRVGAAGVAMLRADRILGLATLL